jgi:hypothetical protein
MGVDLSEEKLGCACCEEVGGAVPAYVFEGVEVICYSGDCGCYYGVVLWSVSAFEWIKSKGV